MKNFDFKNIYCGFESGLMKASPATRGFFDKSNRDGKGRFFASCNGERLYLYDPTSDSSLLTSHIINIIREDRYIRIETNNSIINLWVYDKT